MKYRKIDIELIDTTSPCWDRFILNYSFRSVDLNEPLRRFGLINPLKLWEKADSEGYWLLSDFELFNTAMKLKWEIVPAFIYRRRELCEREALELALWEMHYGSELSEGEKAFLLAKISRCFNLSPRQIASKYSYLLRINKSEPLIEDYIKIGSLSEKWLRAFDYRRIYREHIHLLLTFKPEESEILLKLICNDITLNRNESIQFFELVKDLMSIKKYSIKKLLNDNKLRKIYQDDNLHPKKRGEKMLSLLKMMRYPRIRRAMEEYQQNLKAADLPAGVQIQHPPYFEGGWLKFIINSTTEEDLVKKLERFQKIISKGKMAPLFKYI